MNKAKRITTVLGVGLGLLVGGSAIAFAAPNASGAAWQDDHDRDYRDRDYRDGDESFSRLRELVDRTQSDLKSAVEFEHGNGKQRQRYRDAQGHLSTLDKDLSRGKWGGDEINKSIDSIKSILDKNVLQASIRESLLRDLDDLRAAKDRHRH